MRRLAKRIIAAVLGFCLLFTAMCTVPAAEAEASSGDGWVGAWSTSPVEFNLKKMLDNLSKTDK